MCYRNASREHACPRKNSEGSHDETLDRRLRISDSMLICSAFWRIDFSSTCPSLRACSCVEGTGCMKFCRQCFCRHFTPCTFCDPLRSPRYRGARTSLTRLASDSAQQTTRVQASRTRCATCSFLRGAGWKFSPGFLIASLGSVSSALETLVELSLMPRVDRRVFPSVAARSSLKCGSGVRSGVSPGADSAALTDFLGLLLCLLQLRRIQEKARQVRAAVIFRVGSICSPRFQHLGRRIHTSTQLPTLRGQFACTAVSGRLLLCYRRREPGTSSLMLWG